jgi:hypothetical protein
MPFCVLLVRWHTDWTGDNPAWNGREIRNLPNAALSAVGTYAASCFMPHGWQYARFSRNIWISNAV